MPTPDEAIGMVRRISGERGGIRHLGVWQLMKLTSDL